MPRFPNRGSGARAGTRLREAPPLPYASRYRHLRARYNAALVLVYERTALPVTEIARIAGVSLRATYCLLRKLGARARQPHMCRPGVSVGPRRSGPAPKPLGSAEARRAISAFREAVRRMRADRHARAGEELRRATEWAQHRVARAAQRVRLAEMRRVALLGGTFGELALLRARMAPQPRETPEEEEAMRAELARRIEAMVASDAEAKARKDAEAAERAAKQAEFARFAPQVDEATAQRVNKIAEEYYARKPHRGPRIRAL